MPTYGYEAIYRNGGTKKGSINAANKLQARQQLLAEGLTPIELKEQNMLTKDIEIELFNNVNARELGVFCHQFVSVIVDGRYLRADTI